MNGPRSIGSIALILAVLIALLASPAGAVQTGHVGVVSSNPADTTPHALDGRVLAIAEVGDRVVVGGTFTRIRSARSTTPITRRYLFAFDPATGAIDNSFRPTVNNVVESLAAAPDGRSVFVGGRFNTVNGTTRRNVVKLRLSDGRVDPAFTANTNSRVNDLVVRGGTVYLGGTFTQVNGKARSLLAAVNATNGAVGAGVAFAFSQPWTGSDGVSTLSIRKLDVTPDGSRLVAIGNFGAVNGRDRDQIVVIDTASTPAKLANWHTRRFAQNVCAQAFDSYAHDVDISPDGSYMVVVTTGAYKGTTTLCDSASRWDLRRAGSNLQPEWVNYTGGDTLWGVAITGPAVYVGGHQRWVNNPHAGDSAGAGAVPREGLAALDPANGLPLPWNPGRDRGIGVFDLVGTWSGLWVGSDTDRIGRHEYHGRLAMFPTRGGTYIPPAEPGPLPGTLYRAQGEDLAAMSFDGATTGAPRTVTGGPSWSRVRGAFMLSGTLYFGLDDGTLRRRSFDGSSYGTPATIDLRGLGNAHFPIADVTGMFYEPVHKRLYYTVSGQTKLYYRYFSPESGVVGAQTFSATGNVAGISWSHVRGMHLSNDGTLFYGSSAGALRKVRFVDGAVTGQPATVTGAGSGWDTRALLLHSAAGFRGAGDPRTTAHRSSTH